MFDRRSTKSGDMRNGLPRRTKSTWTVDGSKVGSSKGSTQGRKEPQEPHRQPLSVADLTSTSQAETHAGGEPTSDMMTLASRGFLSDARAPNRLSSTDRNTSILYIYQRNALGYCIFRQSKSAGRAEFQIISYIKGTKSNVGSAWECANLIWKAGDSELD